MESWSLDEHIVGWPRWDRMLDSVGESDAEQFPRFGPACCSQFRAILCAKTRPRGQKEGSLRSHR